MSEWISVKDRLPQEDGWYLVATTYNSVTMLPYDKSYDGKPHFYNGTMVWDKRITHWMPLPEPPERENDAKWIDNKCSICEKGIENLIDSVEWYESEKPNYCPFCGAKFD